MSRRSPSLLTALLAATVLVAGPAAAGPESPALAALVERIEFAYQSRDLAALEATRNDLLRADTVDATGGRAGYFAAYARFRQALGATDDKAAARGFLDDCITELAAWVGQQDGLDRARNHYLRDFRARHGADRRAWSAEVAREYEQGIAALNEREDARLREHARRLLGSAPL